MSKNATLESLIELLDGEETELGYSLNAEMIEISDENYLKLVTTDYEDFPIIGRIESISKDDAEARIIFQSVLFSASELNKVQKAEINQEFLTINTILPLSALSLVNGQYVIYGELSASSKDDNIILEVETLMTNLLDVLDDVIERVNLLGDYDPDQATKEI
jgi:uncharacterized protein YjfI (DUF2170 family)